MSLVHDSPTTIQDVFDQVQANLYEAKLRWFTQDNIVDSIQEAYNKLAALTSVRERSTFIPQTGSPYYNFGRQIPDWMFLKAIYNPFTNLWLEGVSYKIMKNTYYTYLTIGDPRFFNVIDFNRMLIWPFNPGASGVLLVIYAAKAPEVTEDTVPEFPLSTGLQALQYFATADLMEQGREFTKASKWWAKLFKAPEGQRSIYAQLEQEIKRLAGYDQENVLEPYRWLFHGGTQNPVNWISNEIPAGDIDGTNTVFTIAKAPNPTASLLLTKNGQILYEAIGYDLNGQTITFNTGYIPQPASGDDPGDYLRAWYQVN